MEMEMKIEQVSRQLQLAKDAVPELTTVATDSTWWKMTQKTSHLQS